MSTLPISCSLGQDYFSTDPGLPWVPVHGENIREAWREGNRIYRDIEQIAQSDWRILKKLEQWEPWWSRLDPDADIRYSIPGLGAGSDIYCGRFSKVGQCSNPDCDHGYHVVKKSCKRMRCKICWTTWAKRQLKRAMGRVLLYQQSDKEWSKIQVFHNLSKGKLNFALKSIGPLNYMTLSIPEEEWHLFGEKKYIKRINRKFRKIMKSLGIRSYIKVFHPFRGTAKTKKRFREQKKDGYPKLWQFIRSETRSMADYNDLWQWGPHYHIFFWGYLKRKSNTLYKETRWTYKFLRHIDSNKEFEKAYYYCLTHAAVAEDSQLNSPIHSTSYGGEILKMKITRKKHYYNALCPDCYSEIKLIQNWDETLYQSLDTGEWEGYLDTSKAVLTGEFLQVKTETFSTEFIPENKKYKVFLQVMHGMDQVDGSAEWLILEPMNHYIPVDWDCPINLT